MHVVRRTLAAAAAPLLIAGLAACGSSEEPAATEQAPTVEETDEEQSPAEESEDESPTEQTAGDADEDSPSAEESGGSDETGDSEESEGEESGDSDDAGATGAAGAGTTSVEHLWVDDSWTIEEIDDICGEMDLSPANYSDQEGFFSCGPTAASALACQVEAENLVYCITNAPGRSAISFASDKAAEDAGTMPANEDALPIQVTLPDGVTCQPISHDHDQHFEDMFSWYSCDDGSELLTDEDITNTFAVEGETWTVQQSVDKGAPEEVVAETVTFAGS